MKNRNDTVNRKARNKVAIFYKSHGRFIGPYCGMTVPKTEVSKMREDGTLSLISNYILKSPLQLRRRAV